VVYEYRTGVHPGKGTVSTQCDRSQVVVIADAAKNQFGTGDCLAWCWGMI
jgi:hypothetical protein